MIYKEHDLIKKGDIPNKAFDNLVKFASYEKNYRYLDIVHGGNALKIKNYVGTIVTKDGTTIEILPKIYGSEDYIQTKQVLIKMLKTLKNSPFKVVNKATLDTKNMSIFEIFISMFIDELSVLVKKGIRSDYIQAEENLYFLKGKIKLDTHLKQNLFHKERFYVEFDEYSQNTAENRLIKSTLQKLYKASKSQKNQQKLREFLFIFDGIKSSSNVDKDFEKCKINRSMKYYEYILQWCKVFLRNQTFSPYKGNSIAFALLFDMNLLFESYVTHFFKKHYKYRGVKAQHKKYKLVESHQIFQLKPDIVIDDDIVLDAKWKLLDADSNNYDLSQADMYQMYAYGKKYESKDIYLIYPKSDNFQTSLDEALGYDETLKLHILCFDCLHLANNRFANDF
jgi:5-methylcytosine-specific restriction enzyme subunit McrC